MKKILSTTDYAFSASGQSIDFSNLVGFDSKRVMAVINTTYGQTLIYAVGGGVSAPLGGTFSGSVLTLNYNTSSMADTDNLQIIYDNSVGIENAGSTIDTTTGKLGADFNLLNSSFGGEIGSVLPSVSPDNALSVAILNGGVLSAPAMNVNNELIVDVTQSGNVPVSLTGTVQTDLFSFGGGNSLTATQPLPATPTNPATGAYYSFGPGATTADTQRVVVASDQTQIPVVIKDQVVTGVATNLVVGNLLTNGSTLTATTNYTQISCQIISTAAASGSVVFESSMDGVNFKTITVTDQTGISTTGAITISGASSNIYSGNVQGIWFRLRTSTGFGAGTAQAIATFSCESANSILYSLDAKAPTLGQKTSAGSLPVVLPSDQIVPVSQNEIYFTGQATLTAGNNLFLTTAGTGSTDALGYKTGSVQIVSAATSGTFFFEQSNDNVNFQPLPVFRTDSSSPNAIVTAITPTASSFIYHFPIKARYIRCRIATVLNTNIQAFLRLSQESWAPIVPQVVNATAANLNATVAGTLTSVGTITTVSTVTTVGSVTAAALAATTTTDIASAAITTTTTSANIATTNMQSVAFQFTVTGASGVGQTLDIVIQETFNGTDYYDIFHIQRITTVGFYQTPLLQLTGIGIRYVRTVGGTTPSFTMSGVRITRQVSTNLNKTFINRTVDPNTLNSATPSYFVDGCDEPQLVVSLGAGGSGSQPHFALQGSEDGVNNWYVINGTDVTANTSTTVHSNPLYGHLPKYIRAVTSTAGSGGYTLNYITIRCKG